VISEIIYGVIPQVMPLWISYSLYRFESNVRSATVVGMVGAGGVGFILYDAVRSFQYTNALAMLILIVIAVSFLDMLSAKIRQQFT
jgi:phosphonate transport system permease protein